MGQCTINRLLIANRGEIARRIIRSAHAMGISTVAVYADDDADAPFVHEADQALALVGSSSAETYLDVDKLLAAASRSGADAIHPGYGFLSENAAFAQAVVDAGLIWVGPPAEVIARMGDKLVAKRLMQEADVPTLAAIELGEADDPLAAAAEIGYPVLVKAAAGGGGKGMRVVESEADLTEAVASARREAGSAFGDDTVFLERWLTASRHVEIQVLGDQHGEVVHCFERECSIQRRHQKIIEEAPSPAVDDALRARMCDVAVAAVKAIGYCSAGTVEFLLDGDQFWFLEVNTRLQVEHPVTEAITGLDLVREQLLIAQGEPLSFAQDEIGIDGHAIEARLYAEDPENDFLPASGTVVAWEPSRFAEARFDSGIESGSVVGIQFDPMLAKVIVHAPTRREAALRLARVLETTRIQGLKTNRDFLVATLRTPEFLAGETTTNFIERVRPATRYVPSVAELNEAAIAAALAAQADRHAAATVLRSIPSGWRNTPMPLEHTHFRHGDDEIDVGYRAGRNGVFDVQIAAQSYRVVVRARGADEVILEIDGRRLRFALASAGDTWLIHGPAGDVELLEQPRFPRSDKTSVSGGLVAPMPGNVLATHIEVGDKVAAGQLLLVLEAMKMEHRITAPEEGVVAELRVTEGDQVANGELLIVLTDGREQAEEQEAN
ncbi:MAG: ATP-grasp domain-containing protein [Gammaproteobacteria bacterium]|nr:MAG: ATP-grasp domain-containing protein [Gammaproteobacteria bacterium]TDJ41123.1 MAG: ATP-grasp domain-containing protein [Gammaproteobacteria bacterium]